MAVGRYSLFPVQGDEVPGSRGKREKNFDERSAARSVRCAAAGGEGGGKGAAEEIAAG